MLIDTVGLDDDDIQGAETVDRKRGRKESDLASRKLEKEEFCAKLKKKARVLVDVRPCSNGSSSCVQC